MMRRPLSMSAGRPLSAGDPLPRGGGPAEARRGGVGLLLLGLLLVGCRSEVEPGPPRPNLLLISIDTLRADHLGSAGYSRDTTPFLDDLAGRGVRFANAFAPASWTLPSHVSLFTGCYPQTHGVEQDRFALPVDLATFAETLDDHGYATAGFITWTYLKAGFGFGRGFDEYHELLPPPHDQDSATHRSIRADEAVDSVEEWLASPPSEPYFLFLHLFDPHLSYEPPLDYARRFDPEIENVEGGSYEYLSSYIIGLTPEARAPGPQTVARATTLYDGEIRYVDDQLRRLFGTLEQRGLLADTVVVVLSDHGEELGDHGSMEGHQWTLYDEVLRVPMIVIHPDGRWAGEVESRMVELVDVAPSLLELLQLPSLPHAEGESFLPLLAEAADSWEELAFGQIRRFNKKVSLRTRTHKLIYTEDTGSNVFGQPIEPGFELYDLEADPGEQHDLFSPDDPLARDLARQMQELLASKQTFVATAGPELSAEERERLRALGYVN